MSENQYHIELNLTSFRGKIHTEKEGQETWVTFIVDEEEREQLRSCFERENYDDETEEDFAFKEEKSQ